MKKIGFILMASIALSACQMTRSDTGVPRMQFFYTDTDNQGPPSGYDQDYYTNAEGCTYKRFWMAGDIPEWHLMKDPTPLGLPMPPSGCAVWM